jgi:hypothetical protein
VIDSFPLVCRKSNNSSREGVAMTETELAERLERLERAHRQLKGFALAALALATALVTIYAAQPAPNIITAQEFVVKDSSGKTRASFGMVDKGPNPSLILFESSGRASILLPTGFRVLDSKEAVPVVELVAEDDDSSLTLRRASSAEHARLSVYEGSPGLWLYDGTGKERAAIDLLKGKPFLGFSDATGKERAGLTVVENGPVLWLNDGKGKERSVLMVSDVEPNGPNLTLSDDRGFETTIGSTDLATPRTGETQQTSAASIVMFGNDEKHLVIWRAPSAVSPIAAEPGKRPRVFIEAWGVPNTATSSMRQWEKGPVLVTAPTQEMATFALRCPQAVVTIERQKADYVLRLDESLVAPLSLYEKHPTYRSLVFDAEGSQIGTGAVLSSLDDSLEGACRTILNSAAPSQ